MAKPTKIEQFSEESVISQLLDGPSYDIQSCDQPLSAKQAKAISLILAGLSKTDVAKQIGVKRNTVSYWIHHHIAFGAALEAERLAGLQRVRDRLQNLVDKALDTVADHLQRGSLHAAISIVKIVSNSDKSTQIDIAERIAVLQTEAMRARVELFKFAVAEYERSDQGSAE